MVIWPRKPEGFLNTSYNIIIEMTSEREISIADAEPPAQDLSFIREHDREVLEFLSQNPSSMIGFQGMKRRLGIHPEQLARALRRLSSDGLVERTELGYRVTGIGLSLLNVEAIAEEPPSFTVIQAHMPGDIDIRSLATALKGSWIGPLRWQGLTESPDGLRFSWMTEESKMALNALIRNGQLIISAHVTFLESVDEAIRLGHMIFQHITRISSRDGLGIAGA